MNVSSKEVLSKLGYEYLYRIESGKEPECTELRFKDLIKELDSIGLGSKHLYRHQYEGLKALRNSSNLIIKSGTGSGKTEVWVLYVMEKIKEQGSFRALVLYPTLALANDQIKRITKYLELINDKPLQLDSVKRQELVRMIGRSGLRDLVSRSNVIISNPAFILHDLKKLLIHPTQALLYSFYKSIDLIVVDEIDFYGPRSLALLLAMLNILSRISDKKPQIAILTATLSNPKDLGEFLKKITGKEYVVVEGKPFSIENHTYIVLGKNLKIIWEILRKKREKIESIREEPVREELIKAIESYEYFSKNLHRIVSMAHSYDIDLPLPTIDKAEIIKEYLDDEYVTIVFTYSISQAEELVRTIKYRYGEESPIAAHHHLVPKKKREEIEEKARSGEIKVIVSPRTLSQGIDIGLVKRIVHLGLSDDVREYYQREGRKGRRKELGFSETVIIPYSRWDREIFSKGFEVFEKWLGLGIEKTLINPDNLYIHLFTGIAKLLSPWYKEELNDLEKEALRKTGVLSENKINTNLL
ncbi:MAG: DEAD/DEAH box helicase, partial [Staphylothermus sp.]|nr:DEAD/DEAH box helicase [Staphylothermus sp.]